MIGTRVGQWLLALSVLTIVSLVVAACGGGDEEPTTAPTRPPATQAPTAAPTQAPTAAPATATRPAPTPTPTPVPPTLTPAGPQPRRGGVLNRGGWVGTGLTGVGKFVSDPGVTGQRGDSANLMMFNLLTKRDPYDKQNVTGDLAQNWTISQDGKTITMNLVRNARWHDGQPFTSKDVKFTWDNMFTPPGRRVSLYAASFKPRVREFRTPDDNTFVFELNAPSASFMAELSIWTLFVYPAHIPIDDEDDKGIGTGPYKLKEVRKDVATEVSRNDTYFKRDAQGNPLPYLDGVVFFSFQDLATMRAAFQTGRINFLDVHQTPAIENFRPALESSIPGVQLDFFVQGYFGPHFRNVPPFDNPKVRQAMELWIDRKTMIDVGYSGRGSYYDASLIPQELGGKWGLPPEEIMARPGYRLVDSTGKVVTSIAELNAKRDQLKKDPADRERAKQLLAEAGIKPGDVKVTVIVQSFEVERGGPVFLRQMSELFGTTWEMKPELNNALYVQTLRTGAFQMMFGAFTGYSLDDPAFETVQGGWLSTHPNYAGRGFPPNAEIDRLFNEQAVTIDAAKRRDLNWQLQRAILNSGVAMVTSDTVGFGAAAPQVKNPPDALAAQGNTFDLERVWLEAR